MKKQTLTTELHRQLLVETFLRELLVAKLPPQVPGPTWDGLAELDRLEQLEHGARYSAGEWFGDIPNHRRQAALRCIRELEAAGLLSTWARWGKRLSHLRLTPAGRVLAQAWAAERLEGPEAAAAWEAAQAAETRTTSVVGRDIDPVPDLNPATEADA
jgi:hypothetical protein